ncbi:HAD-IIA family hydrolase [Candidatus Sordicultor fermentans]|uniref:HAD-IIA family hydrolase n=1 Tax=Candidatus Sordicultor fermentans TaxID=1953203 RepID=UPI0016BC1F23|nr:HAD-IIA family hydrolase [Candidatus Atribacteria bacterium]
MSFSAIRFFILDMDGTFYLGEQLLPGAREFLQIISEQDKDFCFLTNNSSHSSTFYAQKLRKMGLRDFPSHKIITSSQATIFYLSQMNPHPRVYLLGTPELEIEFLQANFILVQKDPDFVVLGFDTGLTYQKINQACQFIRSGVPFFATHPDLNCPTEEGPVIDAGSFIKAIEASTDRSPKIFGKPYPEMIEYILQRTETKRGEVAIIGDRLYTDIAMGKKAGITTILVLTGETKEEDVKNSPWQPDFIFTSLEEINNHLK